MESFSIDNLREWPGDEANECMRAHNSSVQCSQIIEYNFGS